MINSRNNEHIKEISKLQNKKYRDETNLFIAEGPNLVEEAKAFGEVVEEFIVDVNVSQDVMDKICSYKNCKIACVCKKPKKNSISDRILILDNIQDPGNLGTLLRSAASFGFETVVFDNTADPFNPKCVRSSEGAVFKVNMIFDNTIDFINSLNDYTIYGTSLKNGIPLKNVKKSNKFAIILGNEGHGVKNEILDRTDFNIFIEMKNMESLNVSIAGAIIMYEASQWN